MYFIRAKTNGKQQKNHEGRLPVYVRNTKSRAKKLLKSGDVIEESESEPDDIDLVTEEGNT